ncbi:glycosyl hydrolase family 79 C-terminal domain-containing protein [Streptomyces sp. RKAG290]|uniref:glycosyl hydrolase family 79 C-terminal domain-containing protein n=1 Tax=Streptomyces sp. RKAG290 TaxID=2888348 RepID=UPI0020343714|nr:glycosyl hydrolase family 79 C-terminal domain-containing protein [Streptomyces sp. RKAG290]MCM2412692.1 glycosyl hydrolase family 79 C-terminal domain-containing protein [Streptomyces sp. RKAG290]
MNDRNARGTARRRLVRTALAAALVAGAALPAGHAFARSGDDTPTGTAFTLNATADSAGARLTGDHQGFSVESADFAHGYLTEDRMADRLRTLGNDGVLRLGGYSMDLVWPAFGRWSGSPAPKEAIGGTVDRSDLDALRKLVRASGWKVTLGVPLKSVVDPAVLKDPAKDPAPKVSLDQVVAEVKAAHETLGDDLLAVEVGNEFDNVTTMTGGDMWETVKRYEAAIHAALPHAGIKVLGPSANTAATNTRLDEFASAAAADTTVKPERILSELSSHLYPGSHCGTSDMPLPQVLAPQTYTKTRTKLAGIREIGARFGDRIPMTLNESNSASCSGQPGVSNAYVTSLWSLDHLMQTAQSGVSQVEFHTNTAAVCGDFKPRDSAEYPVSYRYYGAFCAADRAELDANGLSATPLYYGLWAFRQVPQGRFVDLGLADADLGRLRAYGVQGRGGELTLVLINVQDPATAGSTSDDVTIGLPSSYGRGRAVTLRTSAADGLASTDASAVSLGGRTVSPAGRASGTPRTTPVQVGHRSATVSVAPGTAQLVTLSR